MTVETCPTCGQALRRPDLDGRAAGWRIRVRFYAADRPNDPVADSDPDRPPDARGDTVVRGLPSIATELASMAFAYHGVPCLGLDNVTLRHKLKSLRPTLSRRGGSAVWRVAYRMTELDQERAWLARVDIERVDPRGDNHAYPVLAHRS